MTPNESVFIPKMTRPSPVVPPLPAELYAVAYGKYDDYRIAAVFTTEEKAARYADLQNKMQMQKWGKVLDEYYCDDTLDLDPSI